MSWASAAEEARDTRIAASRRERAKKAAGWITRGNSVDRQGKTEGPNWAVPRDLSSGQGALKAQGREAEPFAKIVNGGLDRTLALRLTAGDAAHVAGPLAEANLELATAPARTRRLILDCGSGWNRRQGVASVVAGVETVAANALIAGPASDRNILARLDRAAVGAGLKARLTGLAVVAGGDAGAALRGAVRLRGGRLPSQRHGEESEASRGYEKNAHVPVSAQRSGRSRDDNRAFGFCRGPRGEVPTQPFPKVGLLRPEGRGLRLR